MVNDALNEHSSESFALMGWMNAKGKNLYVMERVVYEKVDSVFL